MAPRLLSTAAAPESSIRTADEASAVTLATYLAAVGAAVTTGMPPRSWVEATVAAVKPNAFGHSLELVDPAGGAAPAQLRAFLRTADRARIEERLGTRVIPDHLVGMTMVVQIAPEFHAKWHLGARIVGMAAGLRDSLLRRATEKVRAQLKRESLYDAQRRLQVPADVTRVAVVHPAGAAGYSDIAGELARWQRAGIIVVTSISARFEGPHAAGEIAAAIGRAISGRDTHPDILVVCRGGGDRAGLLALDEEAVARAVCNCPVPVITGLGHAVDRALCDEVAFAACDTPSKALGRLAALIAEPARRARANMGTVMAEAERRVTAADRDLTQALETALVGAERRVVAASHDITQTRDAVLSRADRRLAESAAALAGTWTVAHAGIAGARERCAAMEREVIILFDAVRDRAPRRIETIGRDLERLGSDAMAQARRRLERADDGTALIGAVLSRAGARLDAAAADVDRRMDAVSLDAARRLTDAGTDLVRLAGVVESLGLSTTLRRGFALATTPDGTLVPTRAAALAAGTINLTFADGAVSARVGTPLRTTTKGHQP